MRKAIVTIVVVSILGLAVWFTVSPYIIDALWPSEPTLHVVAGGPNEEDPAVAELLKDVRIEMRNVVLAEARENTELIVYEQDVQSSCAWNDSWGDVELLKKTKTIHMYGTGIYVIDLAAITTDDIFVSNQDMTVSITLPAVTLKHVKVHSEKTEFEDTSLGLLRFGDIRLTSEQQQLLVNAVEDAMQQQCLEQKVLDAAALAAKRVTRELFEKVIHQVDADYVVIIR